MLLILCACVHSGYPFEIAIHLHENVMLTKSLLFSSYYQCGLVQKGRLLSPFLKADKDI